MFSPSTPGVRAGSHQLTDTYWSVECVTSAAHKTHSQYQALREYAKYRPVAGLRVCPNWQLGDLLGQQWNTTGGPLS